MDRLNSTDQTKQKKTQQHKENVTKKMARSKYLGQIAACYLVRVIGGNSNGSHFSMTD